MSAAQSITSDQFEELVLKSDLPVMVDFWAEWCMPCKAMLPVVDALAEEYQGLLKVYKIDVQNEAALATRYGVSSIPTLLIFKGGEIADRLVGIKAKAEVASRLTPLL